MKLIPRPLPPIPTATAADRLPVGLPFSPDLLWRYPALGAAAAAAAFPPQPPHSPASPYVDKTHLPAGLPADPRVWSRDDVAAFLHWCEREFDLQPFDMDKFRMNGKALCLLNRTDLAERAPGAGDVLHNALQLLARDAAFLQRCLPSSPVTPTSRYPLSPLPQPPPGTAWGAHHADLHAGHAAASLAAAHFMAQGNSVALSPAPSVDSQAGSPQHQEPQMTPYPHSIFGSTGSSNGGTGSAGSGGSNQSDSDSDSYGDNSPASSASPPNTPSALPPRSPKEPKYSPAGAFKPVAREFFPSESPEPNTNGRLLWDFLQQLLNDPNQRYTNYIAWKNRDTGVFKIVDPAGLAKLWGIQKNHLSMNYDKMSRALRYYYRVNILRKVQGERHCYQFLRNPTELKNIKNISLLRQQMSPTRPSPPTQVPLPSQLVVKRDPDEDSAAASVAALKREDDEPTDLSVTPQLRHSTHHHHQPTDLSSRHPGITIMPEMVKREAAGGMDVDQACAQPTDLSSSSSRQHAISIICSPDVKSAGMDVDAASAAAAAAAAAQRPTDLSNRHSISIICSPDTNMPPGYLKREKDVASNMDTSK